MSSEGVTFDTWTQ